MLNNGRSVVSEESYEAALDLIIERDFFPDLKQFKDENKSIFPELASSSSSSSSRLDGSTDDKLTPREEESLDEFLTRIVSEDDASFAELLERDRIRIRDKCKQFFFSQLQCEEREQIEFRRPRGLGPEGKNSLMYVPDGLEQEASVKPNILHRNTRIPQQLIESLNEKASLKVIQSEITKINVEAPEKFDVYGKTILDPHVGREYGLLSTPRAEQTNECTPMATQSTYLSTTAVSGTPGFRMKEASKRERIGLQLSEDIIRRKRNKQRAALKQTLNSPTPNNRHDLYSRGSHLSPAARSLLMRTLPSVRHADSIGLRRSYTPIRQGTPTPRAFQKPSANMPTSALLVSPSPTK